MSDPAIIEAAARALYNANLFAGPQTCEVIVNAVTPLIEAAALEKAAKVAEDYTADPEEGIEVAAVIRALKGGVLIPPHPTLKTELTP